MSRDTTVIAFRQPDAIDDPLTDLAREGARRMLAQVLIAEADAFVAMWKNEKLPDGRDRIVRHGHGPHRLIQTGVGPVAVRRAKVRDRGAVGPEEKIRFSSAILPKWARRTKSLDVLLPVLYLRGISTGDFQEALAALLGKEAPNLSPAVISRLTAEWQADYDAWQKRELSARHTCTFGRTGSTRVPFVCRRARRRRRSTVADLPGLELNRLLCGATNHRASKHNNKQQWRETMKTLLLAASVLAVGLVVSFDAKAATSGLSYSTNGPKPSAQLVWKCGKNNPGEFGTFGNGCLKQLRAWKKGQH